MKSIIKLVKQLFCEHLWEKRHKCDYLCEHWGGRAEEWDCIHCGKEQYASSNSIKNIHYPQQ